ncbi:FAD-binding oxidoreductase [Corallococcus praedator]|uniref:FAD-binding oxidoreductase n=1 Tax=Corallococcus praedator TaxID=2316724 RepID=A0ABX9QLV3_9BACT|nr:MULTISPECIES: FAD-binding oxidoreductase [Corallococcus]RKH32555.1 FAD-binding oxidoreductase [Corallococcus sp. CA031C]RKI10490.1 FAD-binding oxidoreductase [Corallococcus praedator]
MTVETQRPTPTSGTGPPSGLTPDSVEPFRAQLRGTLLQPGDAGYEEACQLYNAMIHKHPAMVVQCADAADVIASVNFARERKLEVSVRGGGHNGGGLGLCDNGLAIDLSNMRGVRVDPEARTVRVAGGAVWGDVDHATHAFGLAVPSGIISTTGVAGLTLGGGLGHLSRRFGLTVDNLLAVDMVLADGRLITANAEKYPDLFWAVRGGGGNFGVVTSFLFRACPVDTVIAGPTLWPLDRAEQVMRWYREFLPAAPEDLNGFFAFMTVPPAPPFPEELHLKKMCGVVWCYTGDPAKADALFAPVRALNPALYGVQPMPFPLLQTAFDGLYPPGLQWYWRADFVRELSDEAIERHVQFAEHLPSMHSTMHLYPVDGAVHRVGAKDTAFSYRDARWSEVIVGVDPSPERAAEVTAWTKAYYDALHPYSAGGAYVNFMMEEGQERVQATYRDNHPGLVEVKNRYDPTNFFHWNQNIRPNVEKPPRVSH